MSKDCDENAVRKVFRGDATTRRDAQEPTSTRSPDWDAYHAYGEKYCGLFSVLPAMHPNALITSVHIPRNVREDESGLQ